MNKNTIPCENGWKSVLVKSSHNSYFYSSFDMYGYSVSGSFFGLYFVFLFFSVCITIKMLICQMARLMKVKVTLMFQCKYFSSYLFEDLL